MGLFSKDKNKYKEMKSQTLRETEDFVNKFIEVYSSALTTQLKDVVQNFSDAIDDLNPLDPDNIQEVKINKAFDIMLKMDYPIRSNFFYEYITQLSYSKILNDLGDEVFQRILFDIGIADKYEKFQQKFQETIAKKAGLNFNTLNKEDKTEGVI